MYSHSLQEEEVSANSDTSAKCIAIVYKRRKFDS